MLTRLFIALYLFAGIGCKPLAAPEISLDRNTFVEYKFWDGELGGGSTSLSVYGDGVVVYVQKLPEPHGNTPTVLRNLKLDKTETISIFHLLLDAGLFRLKNYPPQCCDMDGVSVSGKINSQPYNASSHMLENDNAWNLVTSQFAPLLVRLHPERWNSTNAD